MTELSDAHALAIERSCALTAVALSGQRRAGVRMVTGDKRQFGLSSALDFVYVPYPPLAADWTRRTLTCGVGLQCSPSKEQILEYRLHQLSARELRALTLVEAGVALGWIASNWPGLLTEFRPYPARPGDRAQPHGRNGDAQPCDRTGRYEATARGSSATGQFAIGPYSAAGIVRQVATKLRQDALDHNAEAASARVLRARGWGRRGA